MNGDQPVIELRGIRKSYSTGDVSFEALKGIDFTLGQGEFVAVTGASGSGKSTLMNIVGCLDRQTSGTYLLDGADVISYNDNQLASIRNHQIGFIFQSFNLLPRASAIENVEIPLFYRGMARRQRREISRAMLERVGLSHREGHTPSQLSGGEQQRVAIARALVGEPKLLLADEPTGNLDTTRSHEILDLFSELHAEGKAILLITHEHDVAERAERAAVMKDGLIVESRVGPTIEAALGG